METQKMIIWADGDKLNAIEVDADTELESCANLLNCDVDAVNSCTVGQMGYHRVSLRDDPFLPA